MLYESGGAINSSRIEGALYAYNLNLNNSQINANTAGSTANDSYQFLRSTIVNSQVSGRGFMYDSFIYDSSISGSPVIDNGNVYYSSVRCNAIVYNETLYSETVGCGYNHPPLLPNIHTEKKNPRILVDRFMSKLKKENEVLKAENFFLNKKAKELLIFKLKMKDRK